LSGETEKQAFRELSGMSAETFNRANDVLHNLLVPAVAEANFEQCGEALYEFGRIVGEYFAPVQGGVYADPAMAELVSELRQAGVKGVGQTSWGPTIFALCPTQPDAVDLAGQLERHPIAVGADIWVAPPLNDGARKMVTGK
jgi:predicted sugar kinase